MKARNGIPKPYKYHKMIYKLNHIKMNRMFTFPSNSIPIFILVSFLLVFHIPNVRADEETLLQLCSGISNYTSSSQFKTNRNFLLESLVSNGAQEGYFNTSVGIGLGRVYGLAQCRDDLSMASCRSCLNTAAANIILNCPLGVNATLRYNHCIIRYSDTRFFAERGSLPRALYYLANISDIYIDSFVQQRDNLMTNLSKTAIVKPTRFSFGDSDYAPSKTIYGLVQCTRDLPPVECAYCLLSMISWIPDCCNRSKGAEISSTTCYLRYEIAAFMEDSSEPPPMLAPTTPPPSPPNFVPTLEPTLVPTLPRESSPPPPPVPTSRTTDFKESNGTDGGKSLNILLIIVSIIASLIIFP